MASKRLFPKTQWLAAAVAAALFMLTPCAWSQASSACDLNSDASVNVVDVQLAVNMTLGTTPCTANIYGTGVCNVVVVQRVTNAALGGTCVTGTGTAHSVSLTWTASASTGVVGYYVYRGATSGGPYTKLNASPVAAISYTDSTVASGQTYYYVATAVDGSGTESVHSASVPAIVPSP
jgi:hypothetical protein